MKKQEVTTVKGLRAEQVVCNFLKMRGWKIVRHNWRPQLQGAGQVDILAENPAESQAAVYLFEVKFRRNSVEDNFPLSSKQLHRLYKAAYFWNQLYTKKLIRNLYLVLVEQKNKYSQADAANSQTVCCGVSGIKFFYTDYQLSFFSFRAILD